MFSRLWAFLEADARPELDREVAMGLLKIDYYLQHKYKPRKLWWDDRVEKREWTAGLKYAAGKLGMDERELQKKGTLDRLPFDYGVWIEEGRTDLSNPSLLVFLYSGEEAGPQLVALPQPDGQAAVFK